MRCKYCRREIPDDSVRCPFCGRDIFVVPDYNPTDELIQQEIREGIENTANINLYDSNHKSQKSNTDDYERERRRKRKLAIKKEKLRKKKIRRRILLGSFFLILVAAFVIIFNFSYSGYVRRGDSATKKGNYSKAIQLYNKAISKNGEKASAYVGLSNVYIILDKDTKAEDVYLNAIEKYPKSAPIYKALFKFYIRVDDTMSIPNVLEDAPLKVQEKLDEYRVKKPSYSLDDEKTFDDVQQVTLDASKGCKIYYTTDGTDPTFDSKVYKEPIQLNEGDTVVTAFAANSKNIPSRIVSRTYKVKFPITPAPAVSPSTGQYSVETNIEIDVPSGYTAYYTTDETDPTENSTKYEKPFKMPKGETIVKAVLVSKDGRLSDITTRNYTLNE
ncbi:MAG: chitobiase/beta-hexosaminidase C-terminal domain-containing protein [Lachnospiraceae bacterium]|jgi:hypothetical protein|nr:chitobiase/beta-hexosaminidase C-terminal domain-containing protein [Lachnospiraceae bacterium]